MNEVQQQIDRLVDDELSFDERRDLLTQLDADPAHWRDCALAFVEAQSLRGVLREVVSKPVPTPMTAVPSTSESNGAWQFGKWLALAASLVLAFWIGQQFTGGNGGNSPTVPPLLVETTSNEAEPDAVNDPVQDPMQDTDVLTLWTVNRQGERQSLAIPLVEADWIDRQLGPQLGSMVSDDVRNQLKTRGYDVESRRRYAPLVTDSGQPYLLPVEDTRIVRASAPVY